MTYLIATFRSRSATTSAYNRLIERGVNCAITSTPQAANVGCGLSIKFLPQDKNIVAATAKSYSSFSGLFRGDGNKRKNGGRARLNASKAARAV